MTPGQLAHILRTAADSTAQRVFVVVGSQAILATFPDAPRILRKSIEGDIYPRDNPLMAIEIDGTLGEGSAFHQEFGYYAHGVGPDTAIVPEGWEDRLVEFKVGDSLETIGLCLEIHDLAFSKLVAGRPKDFDFVAGLLTHRLINRGTLQRLLAKESRPEVKTAAETNWRLALSRMQPI